GLGARHPATDPLYVIRLDAVHNHVVVGPKSALETRLLKIRDVNWIGCGFKGAVRFEDLPKDGIEVSVRVKSTRATSWATLVPVGTEAGWEAIVELVVHEGGLSPGQACVFYDTTDARARILGGGFIRKTYKGSDS